MSHTNRWMNSLIFLFLSFLTILPRLSACILTLQMLTHVLICMNKRCSCGYKAKKQKVFESVMLLLCIKLCRHLRDQEPGEQLLQMVLCSTYLSVRTWTETNNSFYIGQWVMFNINYSLPPVWTELEMMKWDLTS